MVKQKHSSSHADREEKLDENSRIEQPMELSCEALISTSCSLDFPPQCIGSDTPSCTASNRARSRSHTHVDNTTMACVSMGQDSIGDSEPSTSSSSQSASHYITTRSATGRLAKRPKLDPSIPLSPPRKLVKDILTSISVETTPQQVHQRKQWSAKLKNLFFEGLFEHGKDFDAIQNLIVQKHKRLGDSDTPMKTKDQIRHFYYRTWHKMSGYIDRSGVEDANKQALELFGLICYNELRRKSVAKLDEKWGQKLNELIYKGSTTVKIRGKNCRLKIPTCRALKKLINVDEMKEREESRLKLPDRITVELHPRTKAAWAHVQSLSKNPRILLRLPSDKRLSFVIDVLNQRWGSEVDDVISSYGETASSPELSLCVPVGCALSPVSFRPLQAQSKVDLSFTKYLANFRNQGVSTNATNSPQNKRIAKSLSMSKNDDCPSTSKSKSAEMRSCNIDNKHNLIENAGIVMSDVFEMFCENFAKAHSETVGNSDQLRFADNSTGVPIAGAAELSRLEGVEAIGETKLPLSAAEEPLPINPVLNPPSNVLIEKIERLRKPVDRTTAQMYTVAELYLLMSRPERVSLEYEWTTLHLDNDDVGASSSKKQISMRLRKLVDVATAEFAMTKLQMIGGENGASSIAVPGGLMRMAAGKNVNRSPLSLGKAKRESNLIGNVAEATLDQSANYSWPLGDVSSMPMLTSCSSSLPTVGALNYSSVVTSSAIGDSGGESVIFRVPTSFPPRLLAGKSDVAMMPGTFSERKIVDQSILQQQHADLLMPRGRNRKLSRNVRKPLAQRTLLPKSQCSAGQLVAVALAPGQASSLASSTPAYLTSLSSGARCMSSNNPEASRPSVITMAPTEIRVRRIVPTPVAVPCNSVPSFGQDVMANSRSPLSEPQSLLSVSLAMPHGRVSSEHAVSMAMAGSTTTHITHAITGVDAFLHEPGSHSVESTSYLCGSDANSMLDLSLPIPEASDMSDKLLDLALANSNNSFIGMLDLSSLPGNGRDRDQGILFSNSDKTFKGTLNRIQQQEESWFSSDGAMDLSLGSYDSPMKKFLADGASVVSHSLAARIPASRICSLAAYSSGICGEGSRDSVDASLQCMLNENSYDLASKFAELVRHTAGMHDDSADAGTSLSMKSNIVHSTTYS